jgi:hypothetical protein
MGSGGVRGGGGNLPAHTPDHCYPPLISNDKWWLFFFYFIAFDLDAQNAGNDISGIQISKDPPPIHTWYIGHTRGLQPLLAPSNILSHRKVPFQKMPPTPPPTGKSLKKALVEYVRHKHSTYMFMPLMAYPGSRGLFLLFSLRRAEEK